MKSLRLLVEDALQLEKTSGFNAFESKENLQLFAEALLNLEEAKITAFEIYEKYYRMRGVSANQFINLLSMDPTAWVHKRGGDDYDKAIRTDLEASQKGDYTKWLLEQFIQEAVKTDRVKADIKYFMSSYGTELSKSIVLFHLAKKNAAGISLLQSEAAAHDIKKNSTDINTYTADSLIEVMGAKAFSSQKLGTNPENQVKVLMNDKYWKVVIPLTHEASRKHGTGTIWCTATSNISYYQDFIQSGPLIIIKNKRLEAIDKEKKASQEFGAPNYKWQYHSASGSFKDQEDQGLGPVTFIKQFIWDNPDKEEAESTKILIKKVIIGNYPEEDVRWDYDRIGDKFKYDVRVINRALDVAVNANNKTGRALAATGESENDSLGILLYACTRGIDTVNYLLKASTERGIVWPLDQIKDGLFRAVFRAVRSAGVEEISQPAIPDPAPANALIQYAINDAGYSIQDIYTPPISGYAAATTPLLVTAFRAGGFFWFNEFFQKIPHDDQKRMVLMNIRNVRAGNFFTDIVIDAGNTLGTKEEKEEGLINVAKVILTVFPDGQYFNDKVAYRNNRKLSSVGWALVLGYNRLLDYLRTVVPDVPAENTKVFIDSFSQFIKYITTDHKQNPVALLKLAPNIALEFVHLFPDEIPLPSIVGLALIAALPRPSQLDPDTISDYIDHIYDSDVLESVYLENNRELEKSCPDIYKRIIKSLLLLEARRVITPNSRPGSRLIDIVISECIPHAGIVASAGGLGEFLMAPNWWEHEVSDIDKAVILSDILSGAGNNRGYVSSAVKRHLGAAGRSVIRYFLGRAMQKSWEYSFPWTRACLMTLTTDYFPSTTGEEIPNECESFIDIFFYHLARGPEDVLELAEALIEFLGEYSRSYGEAVDYFVSCARKTIEDYPNGEEVQLAVMQNVLQQLSPTNIGTN